MFKSLSVGRRLGLSYLAFLLPVVYLLHSLIGAQNVSIAFAEKELVGSAYLSALRNVATAVNDPAPGTAARTSSAIAGLAKVQKDHGATLDTESRLQALRAAVKNLETSDTSASRAAVRAATKTLVRHVGDQSNLILDPDLDSYYVMEIVVVRMPEIVDAAAELRDLVKAMAAKPAVDPVDAVNLLIARAGIVTALEGIDGGAAAGMRGNADGSVKRNLTPTLTALDAATAKLLALVPDKVVDSPAKLVKADVFAAAERDMARASETFAAASAAELDRLLTLRIDGFVSNRLSTLAVAGVLFLLAFLIVYQVVAAGVVGPLRSAIVAMRGLAAGDLNTVVGAQERGDEIGDINRALAVFLEGARARVKLEEEQSRMVAQTKQVATDVRTNATQIAGASGEASSAIRQIAEGVAQQVSALQQVGTAIGQSVRAISEINSNSMTARDNAGSLEKLSVEGLARVATLSAIVARSAEASEQIRQITQVIDGISRKTNLLSLNAQIEAANAGEVGRGFAVVANEVQTLADNVARSAGEIAASVEQIITDVRSISGSAEAVNEIIASFQESARVNAGLMMSVSAAVEETEATVTEINASMEQLGQISRSNATSTEELSATMHDLASVADRMRRQVEVIA